MIHTYGTTPSRLVQCQPLKTSKFYQKNAIDYPTTFSMDPDILFISGNKTKKRNTDLRQSATAEQLKMKINQFRSKKTQVFQTDGNTGCHKIYYWIEKIQQKTQINKFQMFQKFLTKLKSYNVYKKYLTSVKRIESYQQLTPVFHELSHQLDSDIIVAGSNAFKFQQSILDAFEKSEKNIQKLQSNQKLDLQKNHQIDSNRLFSKKIIQNYGQKHYQKPLRNHFQLPLNKQHRQKRTKSIKINNYRPHQRLVKTKYQQNIQKIKINPLLDQYAQRIQPIAKEDIHNRLNRTKSLNIFRSHMQRQNTLYLVPR